MLRSMKDYTNADVVADDKGRPTIEVEDMRRDLLYAPLPWQQQFRPETVSGYGRKLNSGFKIRFNGRTYRVYLTLFAETGSSWFIAHGRKIYTGQRPTSTDVLSATEINLPKGNGD